MCADFVSSYQGVTLNRVINHIPLFVIVTLITLLKIHLDDIVEIARRCLQKCLGQANENWTCFVRWREGSVYISVMSRGFFVKADVIVLRGPTACPQIKQNLIVLNTTVVL